MTPPEVLNAAADLDTSGDVGPMPAGPMNERFMRWSDLDPFTQGYIEAALSSIRKGCEYCSGRGEVGGWLGQTAESGGYYSEPCDECVPAFSDLAQETLARIIADCEAFQPSPVTAEHGRRVWALRQRGEYGRGFPPQTVILRDDGKVYFRTAARQSEGV